MLCGGQQNLHKIGGSVTPAKVSSKRYFNRPSCRRAEVATAASSAAEPPKDPFAEKTVYNDNWLDKFLIDYFARASAKGLGVEASVDKYDYDTFVELSRLQMRGKKSEETRAITKKILGGMLNEESAAVFRKYFPPVQWSAELNALITMYMFRWLVGDMEIGETEVKTQENKTETWKSLVKIKKCRYLEQSGCVGMCVNMCKIPTQNFFTDDFGLPLTMNPNFEDLSCEMIFGQAPPPIEQDEVYDQPCFATACTVQKPDSTKVCTKIDTERNKKPTKE